MNYGLYFHIPFCVKKCKYCDFLSFKFSEFSLSDKESYFHALKEEWNLRSNTISYNDIIDSIYIGGGTPSLVDPIYIKNLIEMIRNSKNVSNDAEITIEINPGTVTFEKLKIYSSVGINRLSIGVQSTQNRLLKSLGRIHNLFDCENTIKLSQKAGFNNINCDLIFGIPNIEDEPGQTFEELKDDILRVLSWGITHLSAYSIIVEEGTPLCELFEEKKAFEIDSEIERKMYYEIQKILNSYNMHKYEISNYSKINKESKHNLKYWKCHPYIGFGLGAASYYPHDNNTDYIRKSNTRIFKDYINLNFSDENNIISLEEQMKEFMMLGFRCVDGPDFYAFKDRFGCNYFRVFNKELDELSKKNLIIIDNNMVKLTELGFDFANEVFMEFV